MKEQQRHGKLTCKSGSGLGKRHKLIEDESAAGIRTIEPAATLRTLLETIRREAGRRDPDGELQIVAVLGHLHDIQPQKQNFDLDSAQVPNPVLRDGAGDGGLVLEVVTLDGEAARLVQVKTELPGRNVELVARHPLRNQPLRKSVQFDCFVHRRPIRHRHRRGGYGEEQGEEEKNSPEERHGRQRVGDCGIEIEQSKIADK